MTLPCSHTADIIGKTSSSASFASHVGLHIHTPQMTKILKTSSTRTRKKRRPSHIHAGRNGNEHYNPHWKGEGTLHHPQELLEIPPHHNIHQDSPVPLKHQVCPWRTTKTTIRRWQTFISSRLRRFFIGWKPSSLKSPEEEEIRKSKNHVKLKQCSNIQIVKKMYKETLMSGYEDKRI